MENDPLDSPLEKVCRDCRQAPWCISAKQCLLQRLNKSDKLYRKEKPPGERFRQAAMIQEE